MRPQISITQGSGSLICGLCFERTFESALASTTKHNIDFGKGNFSFSREMSYRYRNVIMASMRAGEDRPRPHFVEITSAVCTRPVRWIAVLPGFAFDSEVLRPWCRWDKTLRGAIALEAEEADRFSVLLPLL